jgi:hypothetical protein
LKDEGKNISVCLRLSINDGGMSNGRDENIMNKLPAFSVWIVMGTILILPMSGAKAVPPGGRAAEFLEMQTTLAEISEQIIRTTARKQCPEC